MDLNGNNYSLFEGAIPALTKRDWKLSQAVSEAWNCYHWAYFLTCLNMKGTSTDVTEWSSCQGMQYILLKL
jgi:hypothetical protein